VHNAWLKTLEDGIHTYDIFQEGTSRQKVGTREFAQAVVARMGQRPAKLRAATYAAGSAEPLTVKLKPRAASEKVLVGADVILEDGGSDPEAVARRMKPLEGERLEMIMISNRGMKVWPGGLPETRCTDHWTCRYMGKDGGPVGHTDVAALVQRAAKAGVDFTQVMSLYKFDGSPGYTMGQGQ
jgi:isocitrate dehydrogenase